MTPTAKTKLRIPPPPPFKNHGNEVISVSALARFQQRQAEEAGAYILTETSATQLIVEDGRVVGVRSGDKGRGKDGEPLGNFEPGTDIKAQATVLAEGCWGHLTGAAIREFDLAEGREPQVWELGVKEVWKVPKPLDRVIHTIGPVAAEDLGQVRPDRRHLDLPDEGREDRRGPRLDRLRDRPRVRRRDHLRARPAAAVQDAPARARASSRAASASPGAPRRCPAAATGRCRSCRCPARCSSATPAGMVDTVALKGVHHCDQVGHARRRVDLRGAQARRALFESYEQAIEDSIVGKELYEVRNTRQPFQKGFLQGGPLVNLDDRHQGPLPRRPLAWHRNDAKPMFIGKTKDGYPKPDGKYTFDKLSSVFITGNATRDDAPNHIRVQKHVPREIAETWRWMCPAGVYEIPEDAPEHGDVDVIVNYTNCVQCGAITAKGGRLTTPEGGDGPLYQIT